MKELGAEDVGESNEYMGSKIDRKAHRLKVA